MGFTRVNASATERKTIIRAGEGEGEGEGVVKMIIYLFLSFKFLHETFIALNDGSKI